jgi:nicotinamidase-related amidase
MRGKRPSSPWLVDLVPIDLRTLVDPERTAVVTCELQRGIMGDLAGAAPLAIECADLGVVTHAASLARAARGAGVRVVHAVIEHRADGAGSAVNTPFLAAMAKHPSPVVQGTPGTELVRELGPDPDDVVCRRIHGVTPFTSTDLDQVLRNLGVRTIVVVGVSLNEALFGLCTAAADLGYRIVLATDAVAGVPRSFSEQILQHSYRLLATLTTTDAIVDAWATASRS